MCDSLKGWVLLCDVLHNVHLKGWVLHLGSTHCTQLHNPGLAQPISWSWTHQKPTFPPKRNYLHLQHYIQAFNWTENGPTDFKTKIFEVRPNKFSEYFQSLPNLHPPAVIYSANAAFVRRKSYLHLSREKPPPPAPLYCHFLSYLSQL